MAIYGACYTAYGKQGYLHNFEAVDAEAAIEYVKSKITGVTYIEVGLEDSEFISAEWHI